MKKNEKKYKTGAKTDIIANHYSKGHAFFDKDEYKLAINEYNKCIELDSKYIKAYNSRGNSYLCENEYDLAMEDYNQIIKLDPFNYEGFYGKGNIYYSQNKYDLAHFNFNKCIDLDPMYVHPYNGIGLIYSEKKEYDLAIHNFSKCIELDPEEAIYYCNRAGEYSAIRKYDLAIKDYNKCVELDSEFLEAYYNRGVLYKDIKKYNLAIIDFNKCIDLDSTNFVTYFSLGESYESVREYFKMSINFDLYLYYSYKSKGVIINSKLIKHWSNMPYNFVFVAENTKIDYNSLTLNHYKNIKDIEDYFSFLKIEMSKRQLEGSRALLNYYLGSTVASFVHYDEVLNNQYLPLTSQELYYYALTSKTIQVNSYAIAIGCINRLANNQNRTVQDEYYLGQLYLLNKNMEDAHRCFEDSMAFAPSLIMLLSMEDDDNNKEALIEFILKNEEAKILIRGIENQPILMKNSFDRQFQKYFYARELVFAIQTIAKNFELLNDFNISENKELWETFYLTVEEKDRLYLKLREKEIDIVILNIVKEIKLKVNKIEANEKELYLLNIKEILQNKQDYNIRLVIKDLMESEYRKEEDLENLIGMMIMDFRLGESNIYANFISYAFLNGSINAQQSFALFVYLVDVISTKKSVNIQDSIKAIIPKDKSKLFLVSLGLSSDLFGIINIVKAYEILMNDFESYEIKNETHYMSFKRNLWKYISLNKETMSESKFKKKFQCFPSIIEHNLKFN